MLRLNYTVGLFWKKKAHDLKSFGVKGIRELNGLFSSINYGSTSTRRSGINRDQAFSIPK